MAFVDPTQNPDDQNKNQSQTDQALQPAGAGTQQSTQSQNQAEPPTTSGGGGSGVVSGGGSAGGAPAPTTTKPSTSGSWTNLQSYLDANSDQGAAVGSQIAGTVNSQGSKAQDDITNLGVNFNSAVKDNTVNQDDAAVTGAVNAATSATANQGLTDDQVKAFTKQANAAYGGPNDVTNYNGYSQAQQDTSAAQQAASQTQSEAGRDVLLNKQYQNASVNGYTQGENNLDQLLLQNSQGGQAALQPLADRWSGLNGALGGVISTGNTAAANAAATDKATAANANNALTGATTNFQTQLNTGLANLQQTNTDSYNKIVADLKANKLTGDDYLKLGLNPSTHIYGGVGQNGTPAGTQLASYLTQGPAPTLQTYATADQYAQAAALAQLAGQSSSSFLSPAGLTQAGTAGGPAFTFNNALEQSDNQTNQTQYNQQVQNALNAANQGMNFDNISVAGAGAGNDVQKAVDYLNKMIAWNSNGSGMANTEKAWALNQLNQLNEAQSAYGFNPYDVYSGPGVDYGSAIPTEPRLVKK